MTADRRERLAEALDPVEIALSGSAYVLDALLPVVDAMCTEAAADELNRMADLFAKAYEQGSARRCRNRAATIHPIREDS